jgi:hypothetical protein
MLRSLLLAFVAGLALGCATPRVELAIVATAEPTEASVELECLGDCLDEPDMSCDECAARCFKPQLGDTLTFAR